MKRRSLVLVMIIALLTLSLTAFVGCKQDNGTEITITPNTVSVVEGNTINLAAQTNSENKIEWTVADETIVSIKSTPAKLCILNALKPGTTTVTATVDGKSATATIEVKESVKVTISKDGQSVQALTLNQGETAQLTATASDGSQIAEWRSSDESRATVSSTGLVTAKLPGEVSITAHINSSFYGEVKVTVNASGEYVNIEYGENGYTWAAEGWGPLGNVTQNPGKWFYWNDSNTNGSSVVVNAAMEMNGSAIVAYECLAGECLYGLQLFKDYEANVAGETYKLTLTIKTEQAITLLVNAQSVSLNANEEKTIEVVFVEPEVEQYKGASIHIQVKAVDGDKNTITISNEKIESYTVSGGGEDVPATYTLGFGEQGASNNLTGRWYYWKSDWATFTGSMDNGTVTAEVDVNEGYFYAIQLFYKNLANVQGNKYKVAFDIVVPNDGKITVNGTVVDVNKGSNHVEVEYTEGDIGTASISMQFGEQGYDPGAYTQNAVGNGQFVISQVSFTLVAEGENQGGDQGGDKGNMTFGENGYTWAAEGWGPLGNVTQNPGNWFYWNDQNWNNSNVNVSYANYADDVVTVKYNVLSGANKEGLQLFYDYATNLAGQKYKVTMTVTSTINATVMVNGIEFNLVAGQATSIAVVFEEPEVEQYKGASIAFAVNANNGDNNVLTISNVTMTETTEDLTTNTPTEGGESSNNMTFGEEGVGKTVMTSPDTWYYWNDQNWWGSNVTVSEASVVDNVVKVSYTTSTGTCWFGMQLFYKDSTHTAGKTYKYTLTINSTVAGDITVNGKVFTLVVGDNTIEVEREEADNKASFSIQMGKDESGDQELSMVSSATITITNWSSVEVTTEENA